MTAAEKTDEELMALLSEGREQALGDIVLRYQNDIFRFCMHYLKDVERAREMAQETFIRVFVARARFDQARKFRPWVLCIARNLCLNELKRKKAVAMESLEEFASSARDASGEILQSTEDTPDGQAIAEERKQLLFEALNGLDNASRELVVMRFFEKMSAREISEVIGISEGAARTRLHRVMKTLREKYGECRDLI